MLLIYFCVIDTFIDWGSVENRQRYLQLYPRIIVLVMPFELFLALRTRCGVALDMCRTSRERLYILLCAYVLSMLLIIHLLFAFVMICCIEMNICCTYTVLFEHKVNRYLRSICGMDLSCSIRVKRTDAWRPRQAGGVGQDVSTIFSVFFKFS